MAGQRSKQTRCGAVGPSVAPADRAATRRSQYLSAQWWTTDPTASDTPRTGRGQPPAAAATPSDSAPQRRGSGGGSDSPPADAPGWEHRLAADAFRVSAWDPGSESRTAAPRCTDGVARVNSATLSAYSTMRPRYITAMRSAMCSTTREIVADEQIGEAVVRAAGPAAG